MHQPKGYTRKITSGMYLVLTKLQTLLKAYPVQLHERNLPVSVAGTRVSITIWMYENSLAAVITRYIKGYAEGILRSIACGTWPDGRIKCTACTKDDVHCYWLCTC